MKNKRKDFVKMSAKNYMEHDLDNINADIERQGYSELYIFYIVNFYKGINLKEYFVEYGLKFEIISDKYIFTKIEK